MKAMVPQTTNELFTAVEQKTAPEGFVQLFIVNEANARTEENSTGIRHLIDWYLTLIFFLQLLPTSQHYFYNN